MRDGSKDKTRRGRMIRIQPLLSYLLNKLEDIGTGEAMIAVAPNIRLHHPASISPSCQGPLPNVTVELGMRNLTTLSHLFEHLALSW